MKGPNVSAPQSPMITLGMPASSSRNPPTTLATFLALLALLGVPNFDVDLEFSGSVSEACFIDVAAHVPVDSGQSVAELGRCWRGVGGEQRAGQTVGDPGVEDRGALPLWGREGGVGSLDTFDEPVETQAVPVGCQKS